MEVTIKETVFFVMEAVMGTEWKEREEEKEGIYANEWWTKLMHVYAFYDVLAT